MHDAHPVCAFSRVRARSSVLGIRPSVLIRYRVPGPRCQLPGTWHPVPGTCLRKTRTWGMHDKNDEGHRPTHHPIGLKSHRMMDTSASSRGLAPGSAPDCRIALMPYGPIALSPDSLAHCYNLTRRGPGGQVSPRRLHPESKPRSGSPSMKCG
jgi:hypothetical protein